MNSWKLLLGSHGEMKAHTSLHLYTFLKPSLMKPFFLCVFMLLSDSH